MMCRLATQGVKVPPGFATTALGEIIASVLDELGAGKAPLLEACRRCYVSLFTDRAISYRQAKGFDHLKVALSVRV